MLERLERIRGGFERVATWAAWVGGASLLLAAVMVAVDVVCRKYLGITMSGSDEISGYIFAASTTWAYSYALLHRSHIRIDALYNVLPLWLRAVLDVLGLTLLLVYTAILTKHAWIAFATSYENDSVSITTLATPQWIPQLFWVLGLLLFVLTQVFVLVYALAGLVTRNWLLVGRVAGILSIEEEIEAETHVDDARLTAANAKD